MKNRVQLILENLSGKVLDIGFVGAYPYELELHKILKKKFNVFGIDLIYANEENAIIGDVRKLPFKDSVFDSIFAGEIIEHLIETDIFLFETNRVLKKGGKLIITTPNKISYLNIFFKISFCEDHKRLFEQKELINIFKKHKFKLINSATFVYCEKSLVSHRRGNKKILFFIRKIFHKILPKRFHEGLFFVFEKL